MIVRNRKSIPYYSFSYLFRVGHRNLYEFGTIMVGTNVNIIV